MSQSLRVPKVYRRGLWARMVEGLRYGGGLGQWSWLAHRVSGIGILVFLIVHITDTFFVVAYPGLYDHTVALYGGVWFDSNYYWPLRWAFRGAELGLIASVLFHAINGVGIILYDLWERGTLYRRRIQAVVQVVFWTLLLLSAVAVLYPLRKPPEGMEDVQQIALPRVAGTSTPASR